MSGHSKWSTIKRKKGANDAKRGKVFTRLGREITLAAREGGGSIDANFRLRLAVDRARAENMPKENIERAIKRGTGELKDGAEIEEMMYEAYGPNGVAMIVSVMTDNRNRTLSDIKHVLNKMGGNMAEPGSVAWQFEQKGYISLPASGLDFDDVFMVAAEAGAEDVQQEEDYIEIYTPRDGLQDVQEALKKSGIAVEEAYLDYVAKTPINLDPAVGVKVMNVIEALEDLDDTQQVYSTLHVSDEIMQAVEAAG
jgi:YebC/PmpR family DNA-binding regulatory protein